MKTTSNAVEILHNHLINGNPDREAALQEEREGFDITAESLLKELEEIGYPQPIESKHINWFSKLLWLIDAKPLGDPRSPLIDHGMFWLMWEYLLEYEIFKAIYEPGKQIEINAFSSEANVYIFVFEEYVDPIMLLQTGCYQLMKCLKENERARKRFLDVLSEGEKKVDLSFIPDEENLCYQECQLKEVHK